MGSCRWSSSAGRANGTKEDAKALNNYLDVMCSEVYKAKQYLMETGKPITAEALKNLLTGKGDESRKIVAVFDDHNAQMKALVGAEFAPSTLTRYKTARDHTAAFIKFHYGKDDLALADLNYEFVTQFTFWLKTERKCGHNAAVKYVGNLKKIVLDCIKNLLNLKRCRKLVILRYDVPFGERCRFKFCLQVIVVV